MTSELDNEQEDLSTEEDSDDDVEFAEYSPKSEFSKPTIVMSAVQTCLTNRAVELKEGFFNYKTDKGGNIVKTWIPDSRKVYCSSVIALINLLNPEISKTKKISERLNEIYDKKEKLFKEYAYVEKRKMRENNRLIWADTNRIFIPEYDSSVVMSDPINPGTAVIVKGGWNHHISGYWNEMVEIHDEIFAVLNDLIDSLNYFKSKINW